jgi:hypothetical protein
VRLGLSLTLLLRGLYLVRFGWDPMWLNALYLLQARSFVVGKPRLYAGPLTPGLVWIERAVGIPSAATLGVLYIVAHLLFTAGVMGMARDTTRERKMALAVLVAVLPVLAGFPGYEDIAAMLGAGLLVCAVAVSTGPSRPVLLVVTACAAAILRTEALAGVVALAALLALRPATRRAAAFTAIGVALAVGSTMIAQRAVNGALQLTAARYPYYTFFVGLPPRMCTPHCDTEYTRYVESARLFGRYVENHGSIALALLRHPGALATRIIYKLGEWAECIFDPRVALPAMILAAIGWWRARRERLRLAHFAFVAPALVLLVPPAEPMYAIICLPPVLLTAAEGIEIVPRRVRMALGVAALAFGVAWAGWLGAQGPSIPRVLHQVARALERRCAAGGCLTNYPPPHVTAEAWVVLDAGAPFPRRDVIEESFFFDPPPPASDEYRFEARVARARAAGFTGPVLYLDVHTPSAAAYSSLGFDREHELEGTVDLSRGRLVEELREGEDVVRLYEF